MKGHVSHFIFDHALVIYQYSIGKRNILECSSLLLLLFHFLRIVALHRLLVTKIDNSMVLCCAGSCFLFFFFYCSTHQIETQLKWWFWCDVYGFLLCFLLNSSSSSINITFNLMHLTEDICARCFNYISFKNYFRINSMSFVSWTPSSYFCCRRRRLPQKLI